MSKNFTDFAISGSDRAGMPKVNRDHLFKYRVNLPNIEEQALLANKLDEISNEANRLVAFYERRLIDLADLKQSVLRKAFSDELTSPPSQAIKEAAE
jgi:type I restriction enzyme S subunit